MAPLFDASDSRAERAGYWLFASHLATIFSIAASNILLGLTILSLPWTRRRAVDWASFAPLLVPLGFYVLLFGGLDRRLLRPADQRPRPDRALHPLDAGAGAAAGARRAAGAPAGGHLIAVAALLACARAVPVPLRLRRHRPADPRPVLPLHDLLGVPADLRPAAGGLHGVRRPLAQPLAVGGARRPSTWRCSAATPATPGWPSPSR